MTLEPSKSRRARRTPGPARSQRWSREEVINICLAIGLAPRYMQIATEKVTQDYSLGPRGAWIIGLVAHGVQFHADLAKHFRVGRSLMTCEINRLIDAGLIVRRYHNRDRRYYELELTESGREAHRQINDALAEMLSERLAGYTNQEIFLCMRMLRDFGKHPKGYPEHVSIIDTLGNPEIESMDKAHK